MSRQWRIEFSGAMYHVMSRGNEKREIFLDDNDRERFLFLLREMTERFQISVHAWVLMPNHYHLLLETANPNLSKAMQWFGASYTRYFNIKRNRHGHLFQGRYKSIVVENDQYLMTLSFYIHRNPLRAGLTRRLVDYPWSSYLAYTVGDKKYDWVTTKAIFSRINSKNKRQAYRNAVQEYSNEPSDHMENIHFGIVFGSENFARALKDKFKPEISHNEMPTQKPLREELDVEMLLGQAARIIEADLTAYKRTRRISAKEAHKRDALIYLLWATGVVSNNEIASLFGMTYSAVSRRVGLTRREERSESGTRNYYNTIKSLIKM